MLEVLFEDNHLIIVNKACGEIVQADKTGDFTLGDKVKDYIKSKYDKKGEVFLGTTHRLDRPTSGIVIFARTSKALSRINKMFAEHTIFKTYYAVVNTKPPVEQETLNHFLVRNTKQNKSYAHLTAKPESKKASLTYTLRGSSQNYYLLEIKLHTGRHHQIRAQLAQIGCLIKGDLKYGFPRSNENGGIHLHAGNVEFEHPVTHEQIKIYAPFPDDNLWNFFSKIVH